MIPQKLGKYWKKLTRGVGGIGRKVCTCRKKSEGQWKYIYILYNILCLYVQVSNCE